MRRPGRGGALLLELLLGLALGAMVLAVFSGALVACLRWAHALVGRSEALEVVRTTWVVLDEELRPGRAGRDWRLEEDAVSLRAFRGLARVCGSEDGTGSWLVAYRGRRLPDPARDSLLVLGTDGGWRAFDLEASHASAEVSGRLPGGCELDADERAFEWQWAPGGSPSPVVARLFERGEYHLTDGALRYRRGEGGRQPMTPERLAPSSGFTSSGEEGIEVRLEFPGDRRAGDPDPFLWSVRSRAGRRR